MMYKVGDISSSFDSLIETADIMKIKCTRCGSNLVVKFSSVRNNYSQCPICFEYGLNPESNLSEPKVNRKTPVKTYSVA